MNKMSKKAITPVSIFPNPNQANFLGVSVIHDNLSTYATLLWYLIYEDQNGEDTILINGNETISGTDYSGWNGNNDYPFTFVASKIGVTLT